MDGDRLEELGGLVECDKYIRDRYEIVDIPELDGWVGERVRRSTRRLVDSHETGQYAADRRRPIGGPRWIYTSLHGLCTLMYVVFTSK